MRSQRRHAWVQGTVDPLWADEWVGRGFGTLCSRGKGDRHAADSSGSTRSHKGTQAEQLSHSLGLPHISAGDILRGNIQAGTPLGRETRRYVESGKRGPDVVVA